nr:MAG TPA: Protein of unknown function (DUF1043) [Caudoviricetes sp.]DAM84591.1 MAG TPA: Protein of unknown function (DUF1043) [Caudoviricetes sp.]
MRCKEMAILHIVIGACIGFCAAALLKSGK